MSKNNKKTVKDVNLFIESNSFHYQLSALLIRLYINKKMPKAIGVLDLLIAASNKMNMIHVQQTQIAKCLNLSRTAVKRYIRFLYKNGYIDKLGNKRTIGYVINPAISWRTNDYKKYVLYDKYNLPNKKALENNIPKAFHRSFNKFINKHRNQNVPQISLNKKKQRKCSYYKTDKTGKFVKSNKKDKYKAIMNKKIKIYKGKYKNKNKKYNHGRHDRKGESKS